MADIAGSAASGAASGAASAAASHQIQKGGGIRGAFRRIPTPALLFAGGAAAGLILLYIRSRNANADTATVGDPNSEVAGEQGVDNQLALTPSPVAYVSPNVPLPEPAETVGAVGQTALDSLSHLFDSIISRPDPATQALVDIVSQRPEAAAAAPVVVSPPPPAPRPRPTPKPKPHVPAGYKPGSSIHGKHFPNAIGYRSGGVDNKRGIEAWMIAFSNGRTERWHYDFKGAHKGAWNRVS